MFKKAIKALGGFLKKALWLILNVVTLGIPWGIQRVWKWWRTPSAKQMYERHYSHREPEFLFIMTTDMPQRQFDKVMKLLANKTPYIDLKKFKKMYNARSKKAYGGDGEYEIVPGIIHFLVDEPLFRSVEEASRGSLLTTHLSRPSELNRNRGYTFVVYLKDATQWQPEVFPKGLKDLELNDLVGVNNIMDTESSWFHEEGNEKWLKKKSKMKDFEKNVKTISDMF